MDKTAIQEIQKATAVSELAKQLTGADSLLAAKDSETDIVSLEKYMGGRSRFRGTMETKSLGDFVRYVGDGEGAQCFIDADNMGARVFFNLGTTEQPGHGDNQAVLKTERTSAFREVFSMHDSRISQKTLAEWLEDWKDFLEVTDQEGDSMTVVQAVAAVRRITIKASAEKTHEERDFGATRSAMEEIEAKSAERMPAYFHFTCAPCDCLQLRTFNLRMSVITSGDKPTLSLRLVQLEAMQEAIIEEFKEKLQSMLPEAVSTFIGSFKIAS